MIGLIPKLAIFLIDLILVIWIVLALLDTKREVRTLKNASKLSFFRLIVMLLALVAVGTYVRYGI